MAKNDENLILGYVEGELSDGERAQVEAMLQEDAALASLVAGMVEDRAGLRSLPKEVPPSDLVEDVLGRVERGMLLGEPLEPVDTQPAEARRYRLGRVAAYGGLAALLLISGGLLTLSLTTGGLREQAQLHAEAGSFFENGGRSADAGDTRLGNRGATRATPADQRALAATETQTGDAAAADTADPAAPSGGADATRVAEGQRTDRPRAEAMPEMARSAEEMALAATEGAAAPQRFRFQRYTPPLVVRTPPRDAGRAVTAAFRDGDGDGDGGADAARESSMAGLRVKVLARDPAQAKRDVLRWATSNQVAVVEEEPPQGVGRQRGEAVDDGGDRPGDAPARAFSYAGSAGSLGEGQKVVMLRLEPRQTLGFVQYLNRDGQEAGLVPLDSVVCRRSNESKGGGDAYARIGQQVAKSRLAPAEEAQRVTRRLERLEQNVRERRQDRSGSAVAMRPLALGAYAADRAPVEQVEKDELERITLGDEPAAPEAPQPAGRLWTNRLAVSDWDLLFQYGLPDPNLVAEGHGSVDADGHLTVPVIISSPDP